MYIRRRRRRRRRKKGIMKEKNIWKLRELHEKFPKISSQWSVILFEKHISETYFII